RDDGLVRELAGPGRCGIGVAVGMERVIMTRPAAEGERRCDVFLMPLAPAAQDKALVLQQALRRAGVSALLDPEGRSFKSRMKLADKLGARFVAILGEDEIKKGVWTVRDMAGAAQEEVEA